MIDYLEALLALVEEREEGQETVGLRVEPQRIRSRGWEGSAESGKGGKPALPDVPRAFEAEGYVVGFSSAGGKKRSFFQEERSGAERRFGPVHRGSTGGGAADAQFWTLETLKPALEWEKWSVRTAAEEEPADGRVEGPGLAGKTGELRQGTVLWSVPDGSIGRTAEEKKAAAGFAAQRWEGTAVLGLARRVAAGLDRTETVMRTERVNTPAETRDGTLSLEELDRQVRRDARRYDGALGLY